MKAGWWLLLFVATLRSAWGQVLPDTARILCGTVSLTPAQRKLLEGAAAQAVAQRQADASAPTGITYVPIRPHILRRSDGTGGYSLTSLNNVIALTNRYYKPAGIQFFFAGTTPDYVDDDALYASFESGASESVIATRNAANALNLYYIQAFSNPGMGGYSYFPANDVRSTQSFIRVGSDDDLGNRLIPHELGHIFNLIHTFDTSNGYEQVSGGNCKSAGDLVCDTPADPTGWPQFPDAGPDCVSGCPSVYNCTFTESGTNAQYRPSPTNIMSYFFPCTHDLTPGQYRRIMDGLTLRQTHTAYSLTAPSTDAAPVTDLSAAIVSGQVTLSWTDWNSNEMGYFIERSVTGNPADFVCIGGVGPNATTFVDGHAPSATTVFYRLRSSNSTGSWSNVTSIATPVCRPDYAYGCQRYLTGIGGVTIDSRVLSQNSGCAASGFSQSATVVPSLTAGRSYPFAISPINRVNAMRLTIWADFNRNGSFSDPGEQVYQTPASTTAVVTGSLTIPPTVSPGRVSLRIISVAVSADNPTDPCGSYEYGEAEDYQLAIGSISDVVKTVQNGPWTDPAVWSVNRVPATGDAVTIEHVISLPPAQQPTPSGQARRITISPGGKLIYASGGVLRLN
ncbi:GEVED domain-containing protein [Spirosoma rhododendri]|uniref:Fibronectin type-III domain-containing protein n=1 Tax=Spirosoma rhododendri TaxID=2728024 RepID=A0A7L5DL54_9BACT|nr:GEVED domain-containing protein [Spirosoma rhododendri]QJD79214.1 hypothetical protein HH216_12915 [Spirosoma rhododendri]